MRAGAGSRRSTIRSDVPPDPHPPPRFFSQPAPVRNRATHRPPVTAGIRAKQPGRTAAAGGAGGWPVRDLPRTPNQPPSPACCHKPVTGAGGRGAGPNGAPGAVGGLRPGTPGGKRPRPERPSSRTGAERLRRVYFEISRSFPSRPGPSDGGGGGAFALPWQPRHAALRLRVPPR